MRLLYIIVLLSILFTGCKPNRSSSTNADNVQTTPEEYKGVVSHEIEKNDTPPNEAPQPAVEESQEEVIQVTEDVDTAINEVPDQDKKHPGVENDVIEFFNTVNTSYRIGGDLPKKSGMVLRGLYYDFTFDSNTSLLEFWHRRLGISSGDYLRHITQVEKYSINLLSLNKYLETTENNQIGYLTLRSEDTVILQNTSVISYTHELGEEYNSDNALENNVKFKLLRSEIETASYIYKTSLETGVSVDELISLFENKTNQTLDMDMINFALGEDVMIGLKPDILSRFKIALTDLMADCGNAPLKY